MDHGKRVTSLVCGMLAVQKKYSAKDIQDICILAMLHDIGAYKTEEINRMAQFESEDIWEYAGRQNKGACLDEEKDFHKICWKISV